MKRTLTFLALMLILMSFASAQMLAYPYLTSANQYTSVHFDEEGEATVSALITIRNSDTTPISGFNLEIPGNQVRLLGVLQEVSGSRNCISYRDQCAEYGGGQTCVQYDYNGNCARYEQPCLRYEKTCVAYDNSYYYDRSYEKLTVEPVKLSNSVSLPLTLKEPISQNQETNVLVFYKVDGYVTDLLGAYDFDFETVKIPFSTNSVRVSVDVQDSLHLKGTSSNVNYQPNFDAFSTKMASADRFSGQSYQEMQSYTSNIMYAGGLVKTASNLDPQESFTVKGTYAASWIRLYLDVIFGVLLAAAAVIALLIYGTKKLRNLLPEPKKSEASKQESHKFLMPFLAGLYSSIGITMLWAVVILITRFISSIFYYGYGSLLAMLLVLLVVLVTLALMIGIPIYVGSRYGAFTGIMTALSIFGWLIVFIIITIMVMYLFIQPTAYY
jgi:hypothetical protein